MKVEDFDYELPEELIAQVPLEDRSSSKLLVLNKNNVHYNLYYESNESLYQDVLDFFVNYARK